MVGFGILAGKRVEMVLPVGHARLLTKSFWMIYYIYLGTLVGLLRLYLLVLSSLSTALRLSQGRGLRGAWGSLEELLICSLLVVKMWVWLLLILLVVVS